MSEMWKRIKKARKDAKLTQLQLADLCGGITRNAVSQWESTIPEKRTTPELFRVKMIADATGVSMEWLLDGTVISPPGMLPGTAITPEDIIQANPGARPVRFWATADDLPDGQYIRIPFYEAHFSAGSGQMIFDDPPKVRELAFLSEWAKGLRLRADRCVVVLTKGDSMEPTLNEGAALLVNLDDTQIRDGQMYALRYGDELRIKRLYRRYDGGLILRSDNRAKYPDELVPPADQDGHVHVFGRVIQWACQAD